MKTVNKIKSLFKNPLVSSHKSEDGMQTPAVVESSWPLTQYHLLSVGFYHPACLYLRGAKISPALGFLFLLFLDMSFSFSFHPHLLILPCRFKYPSLWRSSLSILLKIVPVYHIALFIYLFFVALVKIYNLLTCYFSSDQRWEPVAFSQLYSHCHFIISTPYILVE